MSVMNLFRCLCILSLMIFLGGCYSPHEIHIAEIDEKEWNVTDDVEVIYENKDTVTVHSINIICRYTEQFAYDRLVVGVHFISPKGYNWTDTVGLKNNAVEKGGYYEREQLYRDNVVFPETGRYIIKFTPVMPENNLQGISAIGINVR